MGRTWRRSLIRGPAVIFLLSVAVVSLYAGSSGTKVKAKETRQLIVHEWGTFLSVQGSDGSTLGGMVDSDETLPPFVEARGIPSWQRCRVFQKMETPVTYFYVDRPRLVTMRVDMPQGALTHWFPAVRRYGPDPTVSPPRADAESFLNWPALQLIPDRQAAMRDKNDPAAALIKVGPEQTWRFARETDAAFIKVGTWTNKGDPENQFEKFLFYRGLGTFDLPLQVRSFVEGKGNDLHVALHNRSDRPLRGLFAVWVKDSTIRFAAIDDLAGNASQTVAVNATLSSPGTLEAGVPEVKSEVAATLVRAGLYAKEAQAMVNTWEKSYFRTEGLRVLYVLPRKIVDQVIPIQIKPAPDQLERVMVGRVEVLTPERERQIEEFVNELGARDFRVREAASAGLAQLGRIGEPALRRVIATTVDAEVRARAELLIRRIARGN